MTVFIGFESALRFLLANGMQRERAVYGRRFRELASTRAKPKPGKRLDARAIKLLGFPDGVGEEPVELCVADRDDRSRVDYIKAHVWNGPERGTYLVVDREYCVASPEAVFVQLAGELSFPHLVELGFMLCGTYAPDAVSAAGHSNLAPLTSVSKLGRYLSRCDGVYGVKQARKALEWVIDGSASVMETRLAMLLCLPPRHGGYGLPKPELNKTIALPENLARRTVTNQRKPDLYWSAGKVALEYDSKKNHSGENDISRDRRRANELESANIKMFSAGPKDLYDPLALDSLAVQVAKAIGYRIRSNDSHHLQARYELHRELLGSREWDLLRLPAEL